MSKKISSATTNLPEEKQYKDLFRPSTAVSSAFGVADQDGRVEFSESVQGERYTIVLKIFF